MLAALNGHLDVVTYLLKHGGDLTKSNEVRLPVKVLVLLLVTPSPSYS